MLQDIIPAPWRKGVYALYALAATVVGALNIADIDTGKAVDVIAYLGIAVGAVATANTAPKPDNEDGGLEPGSAAIGLLAGLLVAYLILR